MFGWVGIVSVFAPMNKMFITPLQSRASYSVQQKHNTRTSCAYTRITRHLKPYAGTHPANRLSSTSAVHRHQILLEHSRIHEYAAAAAAAAAVFRIGAFPSGIIRIVPAVNRVLLVCI